MQVPFVTFDPMHSALREEMTKAFHHVFDKGIFIQGDECETFEKEFAFYCGARYAVGVASGLDALALSLRALGVGQGDEVILPANTFVATALAVSEVGATVILVDPDEETFNMTTEGFRSAITAETKVVIPVHLYGQAADIEGITALARERGIFVVEDCAQAHGARFNRRHVGTFGTTGCFSFYPGKNLGALGDGGMVITDDNSLAKRIRKLANYGSREKYHHDEKGINSRLDEMQAAFLRVKLPHLDEYVENRQSIAERYITRIHNPKIKTPVIAEDRNHVWHIFAVRCEERDRLKEYLAKADIGTNCHYPITVADQGAYSAEGLTATPLARDLANTVLSLPLYVGMPDEQVDYVIDALNSFE